MANLAAANVMHRKTRTAVSVLAVAMEVAMVMILVGLANGTLGDIAERLQNVGADVLFILALIEGARLLNRRDQHGGGAEDGGRRADRAALWRRRLVPLGGCAIVAAGSHLALLGAMDHFVSVEKNPIAHTRQMVTSVAGLRSNVSRSGRPVSPQSGPLQWMVDRESIPYLRQPSTGDALFDFRGFISPAIILVAVPALAFAAWTARRAEDEVGVLAAAWFVGTLTPFVYPALIHRPTYLYYMVIVLPGIYIAIAQCLAGRPRLSITLRTVYGLGMLYNFVLFFPIRSWSGG